MTIKTSCHRWLAPLLGAIVVASGIPVGAGAEFQEAMVPMRDGVKLATNVFLPEGKGPWPVVLSRTPYNKGPAAERAAREKSYTDRGYARVVQDPSCRWTAYQCAAAHVDCANPDSVPDGYADCCSADYPKTIQERAWTSPIWFRPATQSAAAP